METEVLLLIGAAVVALPSAVNQIGSAIEKVAKAKKAIAAPNEEQNERIAALERDMADVKRTLKDDGKELADIRESNRITALALIAILDHILDGNNIKQMKDAKDELNHYLAKK